MRTNTAAWLIGLSLISPMPASAQDIEPMFDAQSRLAAYEEHRAMAERSTFSKLTWHFIGPTNYSGRVTDVAVRTPRGEHYTVYCATASGGVWKTTNDGTTWEPIFDEAASTSIGDIALAPTDQNIVWVGTGEANIFRSSMAGCGMYKSTDGGETWQHKGLGNTHTIARIIVHPENPDVVYVAASGHEWTDNPERGVFKTTDGGDTWEKILYISDRTGAIDLVMNPDDPDTLYTSTWQRIRKRWNDPRVDDGYNESGVHKTTDGGATWMRLTEGLPAPEHTGRVGIDLCQARPDTVYAFIDNYEPIEADGGTDSYGRPIRARIKGAEVYRSDDAGATWRKTSEANRYMQNLGSTYGWVFGQMRVDPVNPDTIWVMGLALNRSDDAGKTFRRVGRMHGDHHALWIDPANTDFIVNGNDGGICFSYDGGDTWKEFLDNLPAVQFYNVAFDMDEPFNVYGSVQDHGSLTGQVILSENRERFRAVEFDRAPGGEASTHAIDPTDSSIVYSEGFYGNISRTNIETNERENLMPRAPEGEPPLRGQWLAPFILSPHNPRIVYHGMNKLFRSMHMGDDFEAISPDLSHNDLDKIGDIPYQTIFSIAESPFEFGLIYAGTDDGRVHRTRDSGTNWTEITAGLAEDRWISRIVASEHDPSTVYLAQNGKRNDDFAAYLWKSTDYGDTWTSIAANIPCGPINVVREDPANPRILYVGTDIGVYVSLNGGASWTTLAGNLPSTFVHDLVIHPRDDVIVIATHGRGMYAIDAQPIRALAVFLRGE